MREFTDPGQLAALTGGAPVETGQVVQGGIPGADWMNMDGEDREWDTEGRAEAVPTPTPAPADPGPRTHPVSVFTRAMGG